MEHDQETGEVYTNGHAKPQQRREPRNQPAYDMLGAALGKAVKDLPPFIANNKTGKFPYADLRTILEVVKPALQAHDIRIRQGEETSFSFDEGGGMKGRLSVVYTDLVHTPTGQYERTQITIPYTKLDAQGVGSAMTYGRRYTLLAALGMTNAEADDDGERARSPARTRAPHHGRRLQDDEAAARRAGAARGQPRTDAARGVRPRYP